MSSNPKVVQLADYKVPEFIIETVDLTLDLHEDFTEVTSKLNLHRNPKSLEKEAPLFLDGEKLELISIKLNSKLLSATEYKLTDTSLTLPSVPNGNFHLECVTRIKPQENLTLEGLYKSSGMFCTQCEAQGFRKITYFMDRPDVMSIYTTTITADKSKYPILLSNGNLVEKRDLGDGRHLAKWNDPFRKPAYLYALVAGDLGKIEDHFTTKSGRRVKLEIFVNKGNEDRTAHAMNSLKKSMKWDEEAFGREYDLDIFMIVAVDDFNFGAMENKGLNIFNSSLLLAKPSTATDGDYEAIEAVIAHEYFHNWTGNRITCRDWFQLSLKEGLTVYRDQEFSSDMGSRAVKRIDDVNDLRSHQFAEDGGPMAHPIRPASYIEINNFYTATVYEKGSEVIRMIATILGKDKFRKGTDKYFEMFDGQAVTTEDFVHAMELASGVDLKQFRDSWYNQAGTPKLKVKSHYIDGKYILEIEQSCAPTPGQPVKKPFHIPLAMALLDAKGNIMKEEILSIKKEKEVFEFKVSEKPIPSLLRGFSAPVKLSYEYTKDDLLFLLAKDADSFSRWEAGQILALNTLQDLIQKHASGKPLSVDSQYLETLGSIALDEKIDPAFRARLLELPDESYLAQQQAVILVESLHAARDFLQEAIALHNEARFLKVYNSMISPEYRFESKEVGKRKLKAISLKYLTATKKPEYAKMALAQLKEGHSMADEMQALSALVHLDTVEREEALHHFYQKWNHESLVMNKWLSMQSISKVPGGLERIKRLMNDPVFSLINPNKVRSLIVAFGYYNPQFHALDGSAYEFFSNFIMEADERNPSLAARITSLFNQWKKFDPKRQELMKHQLERIVAKPGISPGVFEIASKALKG